MLQAGTHNLWWAEVESVGGEKIDPRYTLVSITPGVNWRQTNVRLRNQSTGVELIACSVGDPVLVYDRNGSLRAYSWTGIPFDPCEDGKAQKEPPKGFFASLAAFFAASEGNSSRRSGGVGGAKAGPVTSTGGSS